jgi:aminoglycoside phosphotransferase (APT) family kinase protein
VTQPAGSAGKDETVVDEQLDTLDRALEPAVVRPVLEPLLAAWRGSAGRIGDVRAEVIRQRRKRCVLRYHVELEGADAPLRLIGKLFRPGHGEPIYHKMRALAARGFAEGASDRVRAPAALGYCPELRLTVQEEVPGRSFKELLVESGSPALMQQIARVLIKLHSLSSWPGPAFRMPEHLARCHPKHPVLAQARPDLADRIEFIARRAHEIEAGFPDDVFSAMHGDLHLSQILVDGPDAYLIDLDSLARGDPAADLANLLVFLRSHRRIRGEPGLVETLLDTYFETMDERIRGRIPVYEAATLLRRSCKDLRFRRAGWEERATGRIDDAVARLETY